jgi:hypothetical protein
MDWGAERHALRDAATSKPTDGILCSNTMSHLRLIFIDIT